MDEGDKVDNSTWIHGRIDNPDNTIQPLIRSRHVFCHKFGGVEVSRFVQFVRSRRARLMLLCKETFKDAMHDYQNDWWVRVLEHVIASHHDEPG